MRQCSVCAQRVQNFLPLPANYFVMFNSLPIAYSLGDFETLNLGQYSCPHCAAADRDRLYALYLRCILQRDEERPWRVLDIAPAPALSAFLRGQPNVRYRSADLMSPAADDKVDITNMALYADHSFDFIVCSHVLEHVPDDAAAIRELYRVLAPGGSAILMVPILTTASVTDEDPSVTDVNQRWIRFGQDDHVRMYCRNDFLRRLKAGGFHVKKYAAPEFGAELFKQCGIDAQSVLYVGYKSR